MNSLLEQLDEHIRRIVAEELAHRSAPAPTPAEDQGITAAEAARLLGVSKWRVYEMVKRRVLACYRPSPKTLRIPLSAVNSYIAQARAGDRFSAPRTTRMEAENQ